MPTSSTIPMEEEKEEETEKGATGHDGAGADDDDPTLPPPLGPATVDEAKPEAAAANDASSALAKEADDQGKTGEVSAETKGGEKGSFVDGEGTAASSTAPAQAAPPAVAPDPPINLVAKATSIIESQEAARRAKALAYAMSETPVKLYKPPKQKKSLYASAAEEKAAVEAREARAAKRTANKEKEARAAKRAAIKAAAGEEKEALVAETAARLAEEALGGKKKKKKATSSGDDAATKKKTTASTTTGRKRGRSAKSSAAGAAKRPRRAIKKTTTSPVARPESPLLSHATVAEAQAAAEKVKTDSNRMRARVEHDERISKRKLLQKAYLDRIDATEAHGIAIADHSEARVMIELWKQRLLDAERRTKAASERARQAEEVVVKKELDTPDDGWNIMYLHLHTFYVMHEHTLLSSSQAPLAESERALAEWCDKQRRGPLRKIMSPQPKDDLSLNGFRRRMLDNVKFTWDEPDEVAWQRRRRELLQFKKEFGHANPPTSLAQPKSKANKYYSLARWVTDIRVWHRQREEYNCEPNIAAASILTLSCVKELEKIGFDFDPRGVKWNAMYNKLVEYKKEHGHCQVASSSSRSSGDGNKYAGLAKWISSQAREYRRRLKPRKQGRKRQFMTDVRIKMLTDLGVEWDSVPGGKELTEEEKRLGPKWLANYRNLCAYKEEYGDCNVPTTAEFRNHPKYRTLAVGWVQEQRALSRGPKKFKGKVHKVRHQLCPEKIELLKKIGFEFGPQQQQWNERFEELVQFKQQHGHDIVPYSQDGKVTELGKWCAYLRTNYQRRLKGKKSSLTDEKVRRLNGIGFQWEIQKLEERRWDQRLKELIDFKRRHGHCNVPGQYKPNLSLGHWVRNTRMFYKDRFREDLKDKKNRTQLSDERIETLNQLGFEWRLKPEFKESDEA